MRKKNNNVRSRRSPTGSLRKVTSSLLHCILLSPMLLFLLLPSSLWVDASIAKNSRSLWRQRPKHSWLSSVSSSSRQKSNDNTSSSLTTTSTQESQHHQTNNKTLEQQQQQPVPAWKRQLPEPLCSRSTLQRILIPTSSSSSSADSKTFVEIYLLGTAHISTDSCQDVRLLLEHLHPDVIFLELCEQRVGMIFAANHSTSTTTNVDDDNGDEQHRLPTTTATTTTTSDDSSPNMTFWQKVYSVQQQQGQPHMSRAGAMATVLLTQVQEDYANALGVELGGEFKVAYQYYLERQQWHQQQLQLLPSSQLQQQHRPVRMVLGDRPLYLTLRRCWQSLSWWGQVRFLTALVWSSLRPVNTKELQAWMQNILESGNTDVLTESIKELQQAFPTLAKTILEERNAYMACKLYQTSRYFISMTQHQQQQEQQQQRMNPFQVSQPPPPSPTTAAAATTINKNITIVAVVGAGHVQGMVEWFTNGNGQSPEQVLRALVETKKKRKWWRWWKGKKHGPKAKHHVDDDSDDDDDEQQQTRYLVENVIELQP